jgi:hypothetical protein
MLDLDNGYPVDDSVTHHPNVGTAHPVFPGDTCQYGTVIGVTASTVVVERDHYTAAIDRMWIRGDGAWTALYASTHYDETR